MPDFRSVSGVNKFKNSRFGDHGICEDAINLYNFLCMYVLYENGLYSSENMFKCNYDCSVINGRTQNAFADEIKTNADGSTEIDFIVPGIALKFKCIV